jgi:DNA segregation ATPase FtsK/SpoIIIE-like protein
MHADLVEGVLGAHSTPGRVTGGSVGLRLIRSYIQPAPCVRFASLQRLSEDLALDLRVPQVRLSRGVEGVILEFDHPDPRPVTLAGILREQMPLPLATALLGLNEHSTLLLARVPSP